MTVPRVLTYEYGAIRVVKIWRRPNILTTKELALYPVHSGLFLSQGVTAILHAESLQDASGIGTGEVVALSATAVVHNFVATLGISDSDQLVGDLFDRLIPADLRESSVFHPLQRGRETIAAILVVVNS